MTGQANDSERLPWLEPYREPAAGKGRAAKPASLQAVERAAMAPSATVERPGTARAGVPIAAWVGAGALIVAMAAGGGYWAGHRTAPPTVQTSPTVTIPVAKVDPIPMPEVEVATSNAVATPAAAASRKATSAARNLTKPRPAAVARRKAKAEPPPRPDAAPPAPKVMAFRATTPTAGPPGTVVDLGRYWSPTLAARAYRASVGRYPALAKLKKVVAPEPVVYGEPRLYTLQLGARSASEARQYCDNLKKIGRPCLVR